MTDGELLEALTRMQAAMVSVATGGARIQQKENEFRVLFDEVADALADRSVESRPPFRELWDWYGHWSSGKMKTYQSRREYVSEVFKPIIDAVRGRDGRAFEPTGWQRVDRRGFPRCWAPLSRSTHHFGTGGLGSRPPPNPRRSPGKRHRCQTSIGGLHRSGVGVGRQRARPEARASLARPCKWSAAPAIGPVA